MTIVLILILSLFLLRAGGWWHVDNPFPVPFGLLVAEKPCGKCGSLSSLHPTPSLWEAGTGHIFGPLAAVLHQSIARKFREGREKGREKGCVMGSNSHPSCLSRWHWRRTAAGSSHADRQPRSSQGGSHKVQGASAPHSGPSVTERNGFLCCFKSEIPPRPLSGAGNWTVITLQGGYYVVFAGKI